MAMSEQNSNITPPIAFIGFGEAAGAFVEGWRSVGPVSVTAFDIKTNSPQTRDGKLADYNAFSVQGADSAIDAVQDAQLVFSAVTAEAAVDAARSVASALKPGMIYLDINSCAPSRKREAAEIVSAAGASYVDVAVMAPVYPTRHKTPLLIGGPGVKIAEDLLKNMEMKFEVVSDKVGDASTIKMIRSVMIKGIEALVSESIVAAVQEGIDDKIIQSLDVTFPGMNWEKRAGYMLERMVRHGKRRAEEMREVAKTMDDLGIGGIMASATATREQLVSDLGLMDAFDGSPPEDHKILANAILAAHKEQK